MYATTPEAVVHAFWRPTIDLAALETHLADDEIDTICLQLGHRWRERIFPPSVTVRSIVYRGLYPDKSIDAVLADMAATAPEADPPSDAAWCHARDRLPDDLLEQLVVRSAARVNLRSQGI